VRVICVLGMHRSGTSCLAGSLQESGLELGEVITSSPHNKKGNREHPQIMSLHEEVLADNGGSWDNPPERVVWSHAHGERLDRFIAGYRGHACWGFKCPRTLFTLDGWRERIPELEFVGTFRHPVAVAESLARRHGGPAEPWLELWATYNERLLSYRERFGFEILRFDLDEAAYARRLRGMIERMGLKPPERFQFFEAPLRHEAETELELPERVRRVYEALEQASR
jgi:hypothetical protein